MYFIVNLKNFANSALSAVKPSLALSCFWLIFHVLCTFLGNSAFALDPGGGSAGVEIRTLQRESGYTKSDQTEAVLHTDAWQNVPNYGRFAAWLDWANMHDGQNFNRLGRGFFTLREFPLNGAHFNGLAGDSTLLFTNLPERFSNAFYPEIYFRGLQSDYISRTRELRLFGGQVAVLPDMMGRIYNPSGENLYGFRGNFRPFPTLLVGTGYIRTQGEVDNSGIPVTKSNNIFLLDSDWQLLKNMKWITDLRVSDFQGENQIGNSSDYNLKLGPIIKGERARIEANYRRIGTDYRFVNEATQLERDQEGAFVLAEIKPIQDITLFCRGS
jgi:hypothetical protein